MKKEDIEFMDATPYGIFANGVAFFDGVFRQNRESAILRNFYNFFSEV